MGIYFVLVGVLVLVIIFIFYVVVYIYEVFREILLMYREVGFFFGFIRVKVVFRIFVLMVKCGILIGVFIGMVKVIGEIVLFFFMVGGFYESYLILIIKFVGVVLFFIY